MIETARLVLSPYRASDASALAAAANHAAVARMMESIALPFTEADAAARIEVRRCDARRFTFAIREKPALIPVGEIAAAAADADAVPRLGCFLAPGVWGRGYMGEALPAALRHGFDTLGWAAIEAEAHDDNPASLHLLDKAGFERIGRSACRSPARDDAGRATLFRATRADWLAMHRRDTT